MRMIQYPTIEPVSVSSAFSRDELRLGMATVSSWGFPILKPTRALSLKSGVYSGSAEERARAFWYSAQDPGIHILWAIRGGYGSAQLIPEFQKLIKKFGRPKHRKLFIGYSDCTALFAFLHDQLGFRVVHGPHIGQPAIASLSLPEQNLLKAQISGSRIPSIFPLRKQSGLTATRSAIRGPLVGGNLTVLTSLLGTPGDIFKKRSLGAKGKPILILEDTGETWVRLERCLTQLEQSGALSRCSALILGDFAQCEDRSPLVLSPHAAGTWPAQPTDKIPLRKVRPLASLFREWSLGFSQRTKIPVWSGFPTGHGDRHTSFEWGRIASIQTNKIIID